MINSIPLAEQLRPSHWQEVIGQRHLLGKGRPLQVAFESGKPHSMIFWGPPGVGKTTLARLAAQAFSCEWIALSAVLAGVKDIRDAVETAKAHQGLNRQTILFIDEIHRFNKSQQDALLPHTESGLVTFIGATTENPSFEVNKALLSRSQVYVLHSLSHEDLTVLFERASLLFPTINYTPEAIDALILLANGDGRRFLNLFHQLVNAAMHAGITTLNAPFLNGALAAGTRRFDKQGDVFYDQISALHKSVRGSHPDAALYWLCSMLEGGVDGLYLARRIVRMAYEDIGLADPRAITLANDAYTTFDRLGSPEGELALAQAVIYLAVAPKSNAGYMAYNKARQFVKSDSDREVPVHLRNAPTALMKKLGFGKSYRYAHDEPNAYASGESYLPEGLGELNWYQPVDRGLELKIAQKLATLRLWDEQSKRQPQD